MSFQFFFNILIASDLLIINFIFSKISFAHGWCVDIFFSVILLFRNATSFYVITLSYIPYREYIFYDFP